MMKENPARLEELFEPELYYYWLIRQGKQKIYSYYKDAGQYSKPN
jgi:hypothetical protein